VLPGNASAYAAILAGSSVTIAGGGISVAIPVGTVGIAVDFADSAHLLRVDSGNSQVLLGNQVLNGAAAPVAPSSAPLNVVGEVDWAGMPGSFGKLILTAPGQDVDIGGNVAITGTASGGEVITILEGNVRLDASFNAGGDTLVLPGDAGSYLATLSGSAVTITSGETSVAIPVGTAGITVEFDESSVVLRYDAASGDVLLGNDVVPPATMPSVTNPTSAETSSKDFADDIALGDLIGGDEILFEGPGDLGRDVAGDRPFEVHRLEIDSFTFG